MNPQLSRRVGRLMSMDPIRALDLEQHLAVVDEVSRADSFDDLPVWVQDIIVESEKQAAALMGS